MKLILHIGLPKTGTTSFQNFLKSNRQFLSKQGIVAIATSELRSIKLGTYTNINTTHPEREHIVLALHNLIDKQIRKNTHTVVISEENFLTCLLPRQIGSYELTKRYDLALDRLQELVGELGFECKIVVSFRRQAEYALSSYLHSVFFTDNPLDFVEWVETKLNWNVYNWLDLHSSLSERFSSDFRMIDFAVLRNSKARYFSLLTNESLEIGSAKNIIESKRLASTYKDNQGLGHKALKLMLLANRSENEKIDIAAKRKIKDSIKEPPITVKTWLDESLIARFQEYYVDSDKKLNRFDNVFMEKSYSAFLRES
jgi:hypothetical protein